MPAPLTCAAGGGDAPGRRVVRRLTSSEFEASIESVFGIASGSDWTGLLPPDPAAANGFGNNVDRLTVGPEYASGMQATGGRIADLVTNATNLPRLLACSSKGDMACANTFLDTYGTRLYRRPLTTAEKNRYLALFTKITTSSPAIAAPANFKTWVYWTTSALVQSPNTIYRSEMGEAMAGGRFNLTPFEIASALAYTFTGGPPSPALLQQATANQLGSADQVEAAARAMVFDASQNVRPEFKTVFLTFSEQWLGLTSLANKVKDAQAFPDFNDAVQTSMAGETQQFVSSVVFDDRGKPADLLTAPYTFIDATLARYYGFGAAAGTAFTRVDRPAGWGVGLLAQGGLLAVEAGTLETSPTKRGHLVRTNLLCNIVPPPPPVVSPLPEPTAANTTRERYEKLHATDASCRSCHELMDPIGFGLEHLDASGRYRDKEGAFDIDDSGTMVLTQGGRVAFKGPTELAETLARMPETSDCMAAFMASFAFGVDQNEATCMVASATSALRAGSLSLIDFYIQLARSEHFRVRSQ
ncbi:MAG: hypothetical protein QOI66_3531 [Myxococcales bacterium]|jgi:hypothetical protein|nr:hypothetical protein [Myxococcales bacterium]